MRTLDPTEPVRSGDQVLLRIGLRVTVTEVKDDGHLVVEHRPGEEADILLQDVWKLIDRPERRRAQRADSPLPPPHPPARLG